MSGRKPEELWEQVLADCRKRYTDGRILVQWLKKMNQTAGIERDSIWYDEIEDIEELAEKETPALQNFLQEV